MTLKTAFIAALLAGGAMLSSTAQAEDFDSATTSFIFEQTNLVADQPGIAATTDPSLVDPWGLAFQPNGAFWLDDHGTGVATLYDGNGSKVPKTFTIPNPATGNAAAGPTGLVWNPSSGFIVPGTELTSLFIFATFEGSIAAWAPNLPVNPTDAVTAVDNSKTGAVYTGLAFGVNEQGAFVYAANVNSGQIDVFDSTFQPASSKLPGLFFDPSIPQGFVPFNIQPLDGNLVVTYARQNAAKNFITPAAGAGFVDIFDTSGNLIQRLAERGLLNAPWGVVRAPAGFGGVTGDILIGNFGDGHILAFNEKGTIEGLLLDRKRQPITLPGLWSLSLGGGSVSEPRTLFFTQGVAQGQHGLFGALTPQHPFAIKNID